MRLKHICEVCGRNEVLDSDEAYKLGWDYPPGMGVFGIISARTCPNCPINKTVWFGFISKQIPIGENDEFQLTPEQLEVIVRIKNEPESIEVKE